MNTAPRCILLATIQMIYLYNSVFVINTMLLFVFGIIMYARVILCDIKSVLNRLDMTQNSIEMGEDLAMLQYCKEAIDLHARLYTYVSSCSCPFIFLHIFGHQMTWLIYLQLHAAVCGFDEYGYCHHNNTEHCDALHISIHDWHGTQLLQIITF